MDMRWYTSEIADAQAYHLERLEALYAGQFPEPYLCIAGPWAGASHGLWGTNHIDMLESPDNWLEDCLRDMAGKAHLYADRKTLRPPVIEVDPLGTHFIDAVMGCQARIVDNQVWVKELDIPPNELRRPDVAANPLLGKAVHLLRRAVEVTEGKVFISLPVLSCPINIAINLFGSRFLEALYSDPDDARHVLEISTDVIVAATRACQVAVPEAIRRTSVGCDRYMPSGHGLIDGCATQLVSADIYQQFIAPEDARVLACYRHGGMIHLCGASTHHAKAFAATPGLRTLQFNDRATDELRAYAPVARATQVFYIMPTTNTPLTQIRQVLDGRPFVLQREWPG